MIQNRRYPPSRRFLIKKRRGKRRSQDGCEDPAVEYCKQSSLLYEGGLLESLNLQPQSFIVKVWCENDSEEGGKIIWRGHITHVPSGTRKYIRSLEEISNFIVPFLDKMGCTI